MRSLPPKLEIADVTKICEVPNLKSVETQLKQILQEYYVVTAQNRTIWLLKAISLIDLTTLSGDDTTSNVTKLCIKAANPLSTKVVQKCGLGDTKITTAAVCVYPNRVADVHFTLNRMNKSTEIKIASVATGFPSGLYPLKTRLEEIKHAIAFGANEIDVVLDRSLVLMGRWQQLYDEIWSMCAACSDVARIKVILGVGELGTYENVYKASMVSMMAGADFIKTSTGKETVNATLPIGLVMCRAIRHYYLSTGIKVGLKPAGGIKTVEDTINWMLLVRSELGEEWLTPELFRIGASSLLAVIEQYLLENGTDLKPMIAAFSRKLYSDPTTN